MYEDLSQKQIEILLYIKNELQYVVILHLLGKFVRCKFKSTSTVHAHLEKLELKRI